MVNGLSIAEQYVDRQAKTEMFRGRQIELVTARVVLHAVDDRGQPLCGHDMGQLTQTGAGSTRTPGVLAASFAPCLPDTTAPPQAATMGRSRSGLTDPPR
jgi:hypothetical protein